MEKRKNKNLLLVILPVIVIFLLVFLFFYLKDFFSVLEKKEVYSSVIVSDKYGIDVNGSALVFGMITPGSSSSRELIIKNNYGRDVYAEFYVKGDISKFLKISGNNILLKKNETRKIGFIVYVPEKSKYGIYNGEVVVLIKTSEKA